MSRPLRIQYAGAWYHVMNRGRRVERIFSDQKDYETFLDLLKESAALWRVKVAAYCLMSNHYHILFQTPRGNLSRFMRHLNGVYTQRYNRAHQCDGQLFRGRYRSILVDEDTYLLQLMRYIHRNPLTSGMVDSLDAYVWSSHRGYLSNAKEWDWLHKNFVLSLLAENVGARRKEYLHFVSVEDSPKISEIFTRKKLPSVLGSDRFSGWVKERFFHEKVHFEVPESAFLAPEVSRIKEVVCTVYGVPEVQLLTSKRGVVNEPRNVAIYVTRLLRNERLEAIGREFGMNRYSSVSSAIERVKQQISQDAKMKTRIQKISSVFTKGQT